MRAMSLIAHGGPEALLCRADIPVPEPGISEVLIKIGAAGINNTDINTRVGWYSKGDGHAEDASWGGQELSFSRIQGADICGEVIDIGARADRELIRKRVLVEPCRANRMASLLHPHGILGPSVTAGSLIMSPWLRGMPVPLKQLYLTQNWRLFPALTP